MACVIIIAVIDLKKKLYNFMTLWLTMSLIFFGVEYVTNWLEVVTLGGLVTGAFIVGLFLMMGLGLTRAVVSKRLYVEGLFSQPGELAKGLVITAAFAWQGVLNVCRVLPGYTLHSNLLHLVFLLVVLPYVGIYLHSVIKKKEQNDGN